MLKYLLFYLFFFLLSFISSGQSRYSCYPDSSIYYFYNDSLGQKINYNKTIATYNERKKIVLSSKYINLKFFTYDSTLWKINSKNTSIYNSDGLLSEYWDQFWNETNNTWDDFFREFYTYNTRQQVAVKITQMEDAGKLVDYGKDQFTYNPDGRETLKQSYFWDVGTKTWIQNLQTITNYNSSGQPTSTQVRYWEDMDMSWKTYDMDSFNYNGKGLQSEKIHFYGILNSWSKADRDTFYYNAKGLKIEKHSQIWSNDTWNNNSREVYTYNKKGCLTQAEYFSNWQNGQWLSHSGETFFYTEKIFEAFTIYPNPAASILYIYTPVETPYTIIDMNGKTVLTGTAAAGENAINIQHLASGIYVVRSKDKACKLIIL